jgi:hypothetical protein
VSDTPETDTNCWREGTSEWVAANFARELERERNQWRKCAEGLADWMRGRASLDESAVDALDEFERLKEGE